MTAGAGLARTAIRTGTDRMRKSAAMSPIHRLRSCRALFNHRLAFRHSLLSKRPGVVRRLRVRMIVAECTPRNLAFNPHRSRETNEDQWITDRSRHENVFWISGRVTMPCRTREWMDEAASVRAQTCNRIDRRRRCLRCNRRSAFLRSRPIPVTAWSEASIGRNLAATKGTGSRIQVEDKAGGTAARIIAEL